MSLEEKVIKLVIEQLDVTQEEAQLRSAVASTVIVTRSTSPRVSCPALRTCTGVTLRVAR